MKNKSIKFDFLNSSELLAFLSLNVALFLSGNFKFRIYNSEYTFEIEIFSFDIEPQFVTPEADEEEEAADYLYALEDLEDDNPVFDGGF